MAQRLNYEKARRSRSLDYDHRVEKPVWSWHKRNNQFKKTCHLCGTPVAPGFAWMRKSGEKWQVAHPFHSEQDIART